MGEAPLEPGAGHRRLASSRPLVFATALQLSAYTEGLFATHMLRGLELWRDWTNTRGGIKVSNLSYEVELHVEDFGHDPRNSTLLAEMYSSFVANNSIDFIFGSFASASTQPEPLAVLQQAPKVAMLAAAWLSSPVSNTNTFSVIPSNDHEWDSTLRSLCWKGAQTISFVTDFLGFAQLESVRYLTQTSLNGMRIVSEHVVDVAFFLGMENHTQLADFVVSMQRIDPDVVILSVLPTNFNAIWSHMVRADFFPKALLTFDGNIQGLPDLGPSMSYMLGTSQWFADIVTPADSSLGMMGNLSQYIAEVGQDCAHKWVAIGAAAGLVLQLAIEAGGSLVAEDVSYEIARLFRKPTFYGTVDFDKNHQLQRSFFAVQYGDEAECSGTCGMCGGSALARRVVVPFEAASADIVWPAPDFVERRCMVGLLGAIYTRANRTCECPPLHARVSNSCPGQPVERCLELMPGHSSSLVHCEAVHTRCRPGYYSPGGFECMACPVGQFSDGTGVIQCSPCQPGTAAPSNGSSTCTPCGRHEFADAYGQSVCSRCPGGTLVTSGSGATSAAHCSDCERGFVLDGDTCVSCPVGFTTVDTSSKDCTLAEGTIVAIVLFVILVHISSLVMYACYRGFRRRMVKLEEAAESAVNEKVSLGLKSSRELGHPLAIISAQNFLRLSESQFRRFHEGARSAGMLRIFDTLPEYLQFEKEGHILVFFSYQWLSWSRCGPTHKQWSCMKDALWEFVAMNHVDISMVYVWLDVLSIPQKHSVLKSLAVNSLYVYAKCSQSIIVVAPDSRHQDTKEVADLDSYARRVWCRVEQLARSCSRGAGEVYIKKDEPLYHAEAQWLRDIVKVFDGDMTCCRLGHQNGTTPCDKESLVVPLCGMYFEKMAELHQTCMHTGTGSESTAVCRSSSCEFFSDIMMSQKDTMFPRTFRYSIGTEGKSEERELFGDLIHRIDQRRMDDNVLATASFKLDDSSFEMQVSPDSAESGSTLWQSQKTIRSKDEEPVCNGAVKIEFKL